MSVTLFLDGKPVGNMSDIKITYLTPLKAEEGFEEAKAVLEALGYCLAYSSTLDNREYRVTECINQENVSTFSNARDVGCFARGLIERIEGAFYDYQFPEGDQPGKSGVASAVALAETFINAFSYVRAEDVTPVEDCDEALRNAMVSLGYVFPEQPGMLPYLIENVRGPASFSTHQGLRDFCDGVITQAEGAIHTYQDKMLKKHEGAECPTA